MSVPLYQIDAFTTERFRGNPAAVCLLDAPATDAWMQSVAAEMNLSETAFLVAASTAGAYDLRWFTPTVEVDLCGHATLASAHVLWEAQRVPRDESVRFHTRSGTLSAVDGDAAIWLDFPALPSEPVADVPGLAAALGAAPVHVARNIHDHLVEVADAATVRALAPDFELLLAVETRAVVVTAPSDEPGYDFVSRCFAPRADHRRPGDRVRALCARPVVGAARRAERARRLPSLRAGRRRARAGPRRPRGARRSRGDRGARRARVSKVCCPRTCS